MKIILIGATSGIGRLMALRYAEEGHTVGITGRRNDLLEEVKALASGNIFTACFDAAAADNVSRVQSLIEDLGGIDLLIYNAGFGEPSDELIPEIEKDTEQVLVRGFVDIVAFAFNFFIAQGRGRLAVTSSVAALRGNGLAPSYSAGKAFQSIYAEGLNLKAHRLKKDIVVTDVRPGFIKTKMAKGAGQFWVAQPEKAAEQIMAAIAARKRVVYVTRRWWLVAQVFKVLPYWLYKRLQ